MTGTRPSILIVSNGRGEDAVGAALARELAGRAGVSAYPLVGLGDAYAGVELLDPRASLPSGGFALRGSRAGLSGELRAGGWSLFRRQRRTLRARRGRQDVVIAVGDAYCLWMALQAGGAPLFVATAKSEYNESHRWLERRILRRARVVFARDQRTAEALAARGLPARYEGNPLMDAIPRARTTLPFPAGAPVVLLLPGGRADAVRNLLELLRVSASVGAQTEALFVCALPPTVATVDVVRQAQGKNWQAAGEYLERGETRVLLTRDFGAAVQAATIAVGLAGTANEQVAGMGKPVVAFPVDGAVQFTGRFLRLQKRLLGDGLVAAGGWEDAARAAVQLLQDSADRQRRGEAGRQRMGGPGAVRSIVEQALMPTGSGRPALS